MKLINKSQNKQLNFLHFRYLGKVSPDWYKIPENIKKPNYFYSLNKPSRTTGRIEIKNEKHIEGMRKSCKIAAEVLKKSEEFVKVR